MSRSKDYFEEYLKECPDAPSLVLVRSVELKTFPYRYLEPPILDLCCGDGFFAELLGLTDIYGCDIDENSIAIAKTRNIYKEVCKCDAFMDLGFGQGIIKFVILILIATVYTIFLSKRDLFIDIAASNTLLLIAFLLRKELFLELINKIVNGLRCGNVY